MSISSRDFTRRTYGPLAGVMAVSISGIVALAPALAQEAAPGGPSDRKLEEIVVTAQKRNQRLSDVPLSVTAASGEQLARRGIASAADLEKIAPGFTFSQSQTGTPVYAVRGIGFYSESVSAASTVTVYTDQIPLPYPRMTEGASLDLERVEILKGPQGTLFGQNSTGGAVNYIAAKPTDSPEGGASLTYGRFNQVDVNAYASGPISDTLTARLAVRSEHRDDWQINRVRDTTLGERNFSTARLLLDWKPSDRLSIELNANGWRDRSDLQAGQPRGYLPLNPGPVHTPQTIATRTILLNYPYVQSNSNRLADWDENRDFGRHDDFYQFSARVDYELADTIRLISLSAYSHLRTASSTDPDATHAYGLRIDTTALIKTFTQELRLEGDTDRLKWVVGGNYQKDKSHQLDFNSVQGSNAEVPVDPPANTIFIHQSANRIESDQRVRSIAGFANLDYEIIDTVRIAGGIRYTDEDRDFAGCIADEASHPFGIRVIYPPAFGVVPGQCITVLPAGSPGLPTPLGPLGLYRASLNEDNLSWRGSINWKPSPSTLIYANMTKGYKTGDFGTTLPGLSFQQYDPVTQESVLAYEFGFKTSLLDRRVDLSAAVFYYDYRDKQTQGQLEVPIFGNLPFLDNVPKSRLVGGEFDLTMRPFDGLRVTVGGTYVDTKVTESVILANPFMPGSIDANGEELPNTPKWQIQSDAEYSFPVSGNTEAFVGASLAYRSKTVSTLGAFKGPAGTQDFFVIDGYALLDLRAGLEIDEKYTVQIWGRNVTNKGYWNNVLHYYDVYNRMTGQPVSYGVTVSAKF